MNSFLLGDSADEGEQRNLVFKLLAIKVLLL
jgi:hypothetical protein